MGHLAGTALGDSWEGSVHAGQILATIPHTQMCTDALLGVPHLLARGM